LHTNENIDKNKPENVTEEDMPIENKMKNKKDLPEDRYKKEVTI
jgi:hypothetical protein